MLLYCCVRLPPLVTLLRFISPLQPPAAKVAERTDAIAARTASDTANLERMRGGAEDVVAQIDELERIFKAQMRVHVATLDKKRKELAVESARVASEAERALASVEVDNQANQREFQKRVRATIRENEQARGRWRKGRRSTPKPPPPPAARPRRRFAALRSRFALLCGRRRRLFCTCLTVCCVAIMPPSCALCPQVRKSARKSIQQHLLAVVERMAANSDSGY